MGNLTSRNRLRNSAFLLFLAGGIFLGGQGIVQGATTKGKDGLLLLGSEAPDFHLKDVITGKVVSRDDFQDKKALLVIFICRHCPYVQQIKKGLAQLGNDYAGKEVGMVAISSNDPSSHPMDSPESLKEMALEEGFTFPFLFDETQEMAKAYTAICTPDSFLLDQDRRLVYRGQFDDSRPFSFRPVTGKDIRDAIDAVLAGKPVSTDQKPSVGCSIKWKRGNEPAYTR